MSFMKRWRRWSARLLRVGCLASALGLAPTLASAQMPTTIDLPKADKLPPKHFTNRTSFRLPVQMSPATKADTREVHLYVKQDGSDWVRVESAAAGADFLPKVSREGEYWFTLQTVSKSGKATPADVTKTPPGQRIVVDLTAPVLDVQPGVTPEGDFCLRCNAMDANLDPATLKAISKTDKGDRPLEPAPGMPDAFRFKSPELLVFPVRVMVADRAGNITTKDVNIRDMVLAASGGGHLTHAGHKVTPPAAGHEVMIPPPKSGGPAILPGGGPPHSATPIDPPPPMGGLPMLPPPATMPLFPAGGPTPITPKAAHETHAPIGIEPKTGVPRQIVNTTQVSIDYRIDTVGPSGVGRVEVFMTTDNGQSWKKIKDDTDRRSPAEIELPGEGLFGLKLCITNGNGFGGTPPVRGEAPTCWVEVDTTSPHIALSPIEPIAHNGFLELRWTAGDAHLSAEPISLFFRVRAESPWQPIARSLKNDGLYRWAFPRDLGASFWIKAEVADQAGNVARAETPGPVVLDMTEPRASVLGISSISVRPTPPSGH